MEKRGNMISRLFFINLHPNEGFGGFRVFLINVWKSNTLRDWEKCFQEICERMTKQISSSFLVIASMQASELELLGWKSFTVYFKHTQGLILFCTKENCHTYKYKVTNNDHNKPRKGLEPELMKVPMWPLFYPVSKQKSAYVALILPCLQAEMRFNLIYLLGLLFT